MQDKNEVISGYQRALQRFLRLLAHLHGGSVLVEAQASATSSWPSCQRRRKVNSGSN